MSVNRSVKQEQHSRTSTSLVVFLFQFSGLKFQIMGLGHHLPCRYVTWLPMIALLCLSIDISLATPLPLDTNLSTAAANVSAVRNPVCDKDLGGPPVTKPDPGDCEAAIARFQRDPRGKPVPRNFIIKDSDRISGMPNVKMPISKTVGWSHTRGDKELQGQWPTTDDPLQVLVQYKPSSQPNFGTYPMKLLRGSTFGVPHAIF